VNDLSNVDPNESELRPAFSRKLLSKDEARRIAANIA
jgi:hypothetical protein